MPRVQPPNQPNGQNNQSNKLKKILLIVGSIVILLIFCMLLGTFIIVNIWFDDCDEGYTGEDCDTCDAGFHRNLENCIEGACSNIGTLQVDKDGSCSCKNGFVGPQCNTCDLGLSGELCDLCSIGYHKQDNICKEGDCHAEGTEQRGSDGSCECLPNFAGARCNETVNIILNCNSIGTMKEESSNCVCKVGFNGSACELCDNGFIITDDGDCILDEIIQSTTLKTVTTSTTTTPTVPSMTTSTTVLNTCEPGFSGENCDECANRFTGANCNQCVLGFSGTQCDQCAKGFTGKDCKECGIGFTGQFCEDCDSGYSGENCDSCTLGYTKENDLCVQSSQCEAIGTANIADYSCICKVGFTGPFCEKCDVDYHYHESYCHYGQCGGAGTKGRTGTGMCVCKDKFTGPQCMNCIQGYMGTYCDVCNFGFHKGEDNKCLEGDCNLIGTDSRNSDGSCLCKTTFAGYQCNECYMGYNGTYCDICAKDFHNIDGNCFVGECNIFGASQKDSSGKCVCKEAFAGYTCHECQVGYKDDNCNSCESGYYQYNGTCYEGECSFPGTEVREINGICTCKEGYVGAQCDKCNKGFHLALGHCNAGECNDFGTEYKTKWGECQCKNKFEGAACETCILTWSGDNCDKCSDGYILGYGKCQEGECDTDGTDIRTDNGTCLCNDGFYGIDCTASAICNDCLCDPGYNMHQDGSCKSQKILVVMTEWGQDNTPTEIIDLHSDQFTCNGLPDFKKDMVNGVAGIVNGVPMVCGGSIYKKGVISDDTDVCFVLRNKEWMTIDHRLRNPGMHFGRGNVVVDDQIFVSGGWQDLNDWPNEPALEETYFMGENTQSNYHGYMPFKAYDHCNVLLNDTHILQTGGAIKFGEREASKTTYFFDFSLKNWTQGPDMIGGRREHGCSQVLLGGKQIVFVAGGRSTSDGAYWSYQLKTVEYLDMKNIEMGWRKTINLPEAHCPLAMITSLDNRKAFIINDKTVIWAMVCDEPLPERCYFTDQEGSGRLAMGRLEPIVLPISESLVEELCSE